MGLTIVCTQYIPNWIDKYIRSLGLAKPNYDNDNDNDDNETMFIAKWHTVHVQRTYVKNRSSRTNIHEIYKTWQRELEAIVVYVPQ